MLEVLPELDQAARERAAARIIAPMLNESSGLNQDDANIAHEQVLKLLNDANLVDVFGPGSRAEVPISGLLGKNVVSGVIDRLVIGDDKITIIDFKTGQSPKTGKHINPSYIIQQGIYVSVLKQIWPNREIEAGLIYTEDAWIEWLNQKDIKEKIDLLLDG